MALTFLPPTMKPTAPEFFSTYSYALLDEATAKDAKKASLQIKKNLGDAMSSFLDVGFDLKSVKEKLPHGEFGKWIAAEFNMTSRTAQNLMNAASLAGTIGSSVVECLPQTVVYMLAAPNTPPAIAVDVYERMEQGEVPNVKAIRSQIKAATTHLKKATAPTVGKTVTTLTPAYSKFYSQIVDMIAGGKVPPIKLITKLTDAAFQHGIDTANAHA